MKILSKYFTKQLYNSPTVGEGITFRGAASSRWIVVFPRSVNASPKVFPPYRQFDVTAVRPRTWIEEWRGALSQLGSPRPPHPAICQPTSTTDSQPLVVLLPCGDPSLSSEPGHRFSLRLLGYPLAG